MCSREPNTLSIMNTKMWTDWRAVIEDFRAVRLLSLPNMRSVASLLLYTVWHSIITNEKWRFSSIILKYLASCACMKHGWLVGWRT